MTVDEAIAVVKRLSFGNYRPKLKIDAEADHDGLALGVTATLQDVKHSGTGAEGVMVREAHKIPLYFVAMLSESDLVRVIWKDVLEPLVVHELKEHFRLDGQRVYDPHPDRRLP